MPEQQHTHSVWFYVGAKRWGWDVVGTDGANKMIQKIGQLGITRRTKGGTVIIVPWHAITKIEVKPIRRRTRGVQ